MKNRPRSGNSERRQAKFEHKYYNTGMEENQVDKYLNRILIVARSIGTVKSLEMKEACSYLSKRIEIEGVTESGERFEIKVKVGENANENT